MTFAGDRTAIAAITANLHSKDITTAIDGCPSGHVDVEVREDSLVLSIIDPDGRRVHRTVSDPATAAALIESMAAVEAPHVEAPRIEAAPVRVAVAEPPTFSPERGSVIVVHQSPPSVRGAVAVTAETSLATDHSLWYGARASGCVGFGAVCVGGIARFERDSAVSGDTMLSSGTASRTGTALLLAGDYTIARDRFSITPGVATGVGWLRVRHDYITGDTIEVDTGGLHLEAHVAATIPLGHLIDIRLGAAVEVAPMAHTQPFKEEMREAPGEPRAFGRIELGLELRNR